MVTRTVLAAFVVATATLAGGCATSGLLFDAEVTRTNTHTVLAFEETVFNKHRVRDGFDRYVGAQFRQHSAVLPDDRDAAIADLSHLLTTDYPASRKIVQRTVAQGDLVAVQALWDQRPGETRGVAIVDIFRLVDGKIVEHWDVAQSLTDAKASD